jgi:hypothetical protein
MRKRGEIFPASHAGNGSKGLKRYNFKRPRNLDSTLMFPQVWVYDARQYLSPPWANDILF